MIVCSLSQGGTVGMVGLDEGESEMGGQPCMIVCSSSQGTVGMMGWEEG